MKLRPKLPWLFGTLACGLVAAVFLFFLVTSGKHNSTAKMEAATNRKPPISEIEPDALKDWEVMKSGKAGVTNAQGRLTPEARKRMREMLALQLKNSESPESSLKVELTGEDHDVLSFRAGTVNVTTVTTFLNAVQENDPDFWNSIRLASFKEITFAGEGFSRTIREPEIIKRSQGYEGFLQTFASSNAPAQGMEDDKSGLSKAAKRTLRQNLVLTLNGGFKAQNQQLALTLEGTDEDRMVFALSAMDDRLADSILSDFKNAKTANFWNSLRMLSFSEIVFRGEHFSKAVPRATFIQWCRDYDNYVSQTRKAIDETRAAKKAEPTAR